MAIKVHEDFDPVEYLKFIKEQAEISDQMKKKALKDGALIDAYTFDVDRTTFSFLAESFEHFIKTGRHL